MCVDMDTALLKLFFMQQLLNTNDCCGLAEVITQAGVAAGFRVTACIGLD